MDRGRSPATERITLAPPPQLATGPLPPGSVAFSLEGGRDSSISSPGESGDARSLPPSSFFSTLPSCTSFGDVKQSVLLLLLLVNVLLLSTLLLC